MRHEVRDPRSGLFMATSSYRKRFVSMSYKYWSKLDG